MSEDKAVAEMDLEALPRSINGAHDRLQTVMRKFWKLEDFLFGPQVKKSLGESPKEPESGVLCKCFCGIHRMDASISEFHEQVDSILSRLGVQGEDAPERN